jgi:hypothetical protein
MQKIASYHEEKMINVGKLVNFFFVINFCSSLGLGGIYKKINLHSARFMVLPRMNL